MLKRLKNRSMKQNGVTLLLAVTLTSIWAVGIAGAQSRVNPQATGISKLPSTSNWPICPPLGLHTGAPLRRAQQSLPAVASAGQIQWRCRRGSAPPLANP